jgi:dTDP-4-amino-4,6-dideoxygalactose transaminase
LRVLRNHGQLEPGHFVTAAGNERMTELAAAIGQVQLGKLTRLCDQRRALAEQLIAAVPGLSVQNAPLHGHANRQTMGLLVGAPGAGSAGRDRAIVELATRGVQAGKLSYALHTLPQFADEAAETSGAGRSLAAAEDIAARGMCVPLFPGMLPAQLAHVIDALKEVVA